MKNIYSWGISAIVFIVIMTIGFVTFRESAECVNTLGNDSSLSGPGPCGDKRTLEDADDFTAHTLFSVIIASGLSIIAWGLVWIALWKNSSVLKKIGAALLMLAFAVLVLVATTAIASVFPEELVDEDHAIGVIIMLLRVILASLSALALIYVIFKHKHNAKSPKLVP